MNKYFLVSLVLLGVMIAPITFAANLVVNGDFEVPEVTNSANWDIFPNGTSDLGWQVEWLPGADSYGGDIRPSVANLELHKNVLGPANTGDQYTELDSDWYGPSDSTTNEPASIKIYQNITTIPGATYKLSYAWRLRPNVASSMKVYWNGAEKGSHSGTGGGTTTWNNVGPIEIVATSSTTELKFVEEGNSDSLGMFLDSVVLELKEVPTCYIPGKTVFASTVTGTVQGKNKDGSSVLSIRSVPKQGLVLEYGNYASNFYSLGFGGWITVGFEDIIVDGPGNDLKITEDTWGAYPLEQADVYVSQNGTDWVKIGTANNSNSVSSTHTTSEFDLASLGLAWAKYVKVVDTTNPGIHVSSADGYDLNAIEALSPGYIGECIKDLEVTKTADTSFTRTYSWTIDKTVDYPALTLSTGQSYIVNFSVKADSSYIDSDWAVNGSITIHNPNDQAVTVTSVTDSLDITVDCPQALPYSLAAGSDLVCTYSANLTDASQLTNTATVNEEFTGTADVIFTEPTSEVDECITLDDDLYASFPKQVCEDAIFTYPIQVGPYNEPGTYITSNTASYITNDTLTQGSDSQNVTVSITGCTLTQGYWKNHSEHGKAPYDDNWALIGGADTLFFSSGQTGQTWYEVFWTAPKGGNVYYQLAHQYMAAELNVLNGASTTSEVTAALSGAETWLNKITDPSVVIKAKDAPNVKNWASVLAKYNEGLIGPGHCDEQN